MAHYRRILVCLFFVTGVLIAAGVSAKGDGSTAENKVPRRVESKAVQLTKELEKQGFQVSRGYFKLWTIEECDYTVKLLGTCIGNNAAAPYVITVLPPWPKPEDEWVDPVTNNFFGPSAVGYHDIYRFDPREAIVILGLLPPQAAYFSEQTWLFTREQPLDKSNQTYNDMNDDPVLQPFLSIFFATEPNHPERTEDLSSLSNIVNNVVIERQAGSAFNQVRYFIVTPDQFMDTVVRNAFAHISVKDKDVFTERIPSDMRVGLGPSADDFTTWFRYAHPRDGGRPGTPSDRWRRELPMVALRVRDTRVNRAVQPYPPVVLEHRTAVDEHQFKTDLEALLFAVSERWGQPCANTDCSDRAETFVDLQTDPAHIVGPRCISATENCLLDNLDTSYQLYGILPLDNDEIYAVAGTLGTQTGNATYVGFGVNQVSQLKGVADLSDRDLRHTAKAYAREIENTDKLFLYYFTRDCSDLGVLTDGNCLSLTKDLIPEGDKLAISVRDYIKPGTQRGPDSSKVLPTMVIQLQRP